MKNTFRKSTLISSVALLLVAIVALSGATFAWFTSSKTAKANDISVTSTAAGGLLISEDGSSYGSVINYKQKVDGKRTDELAPASSDFSGDTVTFYQGMAADAGKFSVDATTGFAKVTTAVGAYNVYDLYAKSAADTGDLTVTFTENPADDGAYARLAIVDDDNNLVFYYHAADDNLQGPANGTASTAINSDFYNTNSDVIVTGKTTAKTIFEDLGTDAEHFTIYVWYEGQDVNCISTESAKNFAASLTFELTTATSNG